VGGDGVFVMLCTDRVNGGISANHTEKHVVFFKYQRTKGSIRCIAACCDSCEAGGQSTGAWGSQSHIISVPLSRFGVSFEPWCSTLLSQFLPRK